MDLSTIINQPDTIIIDVREPFEYAMGHVEGAVNIPLGTIPSRVEEFRNMEAPLVLYCRSGNRSGQAVGFLRANGIEEIFNGGSLEDMNYFLRKAA
jgi:phage shock protein E